MPRLYRLAATLVGRATKSTRPCRTRARNWSGVFHKMNSVVWARSCRAPLSSMCINGLETGAGGPAKTSRSRRAGGVSAIACNHGAVGSTSMTSNRARRSGREDASGIN
ncbi:hypothetical protein D3C77_638370 [compost metagenome]